MNEKPRVVRAAGSGVDLTRSLHVSAFTSVTNLTALVCFVIICFFPNTSLGISFTLTTLLCYVFSFQLHLTLVCFSQLMCVHLTFLAFGTHKNIWPEGCITFYLMQN